MTRARTLKEVDKMISKMPNRIKKPGILASSSFNLPHKYKGINIYKIQIVPKNTMYLTEEANIKAMFWNKITHLK